MTLSLSRWHFNNSVNPKYTDLFVPKWALQAYIAHPEWGKFVDIKYINKYGNEIQPITDIPVSGSLPVCHIISSPTDPGLSYIEADIFIDAMGLNGLIDFGSQQNPIKAQLVAKNSDTSIAYQKRNYSLSLIENGSPLGFPANRNFELKAYPEIQSYISAETSYELGRLIGLGWQPRSYPVEVIKDGVNMGVYAFSETITLDSGRLDIEAQPDNSTNPFTVSGGWLLKFNLPYKHRIIVPSELSSFQNSWISEQLGLFSKCIYQNDENYKLSEIIDIESIAKMYIVEELRGNTHAFINEPYLYKGINEKWMFGPLGDTDLNFAFHVRKGHIWQEAEYRYNKYLVDVNDKDYYTWPRELIDKPEFRAEVKRVWNEFYPDKFEKIFGFIDDFYSLTECGYSTNGQVWPDFVGYGYEHYYSTLKNRVKAYAEWFDNVVKNDTFTSVDITQPDDVSGTPDCWYTLQGVRLSSRPTVPGIYIECKDGITRKIMVGQTE